MSAILIERAGPLVTIQDRGRPGCLGYGISASGPMDRGAFDRAGARLGFCSSTAIEFTRAGLAFSVEGAPVRAAFEGGSFVLDVNGERQPWQVQIDLAAGDRVDITPGPAGNYGYVRFDREFAIPPVLGSRATNIVAGLGGLEGRSLRAGDWLDFDDTPPVQAPPAPRASFYAGPIRVLWGLHADGYDAETRLHFVGTEFRISSRLDRMGVRLVDPTGGFARQPALTLVSDAIVPGDIQILGDGTPIVLMRDHQPTGGYPRIGTIASVDLDRFAQLRPGEPVMFDTITLKRARALLRETV